MADEEARQIRLGARTANDADLVLIERGDAVDRIDLQLLLDGVDRNGEDGVVANALGQFGDEDVVVLPLPVKPDRRNCRGRYKSSGTAMILRSAGRPAIARLGFPLAAGCVPLHLEAVP